MTGATGAGTNDDTLNIDLNADLATDADDGYTLDIDGSGSDLDANVSEINISGSSAVVYAVEASATALGAIDASASEGNITVDASLFAGTQGIVYTGSAGIDTVTSTSFADLITLGDGKDVVTIASGTSTENAMDKVVDFDISAAGDQIKTVSGNVAANVSGVDVSGADADGNALDIEAIIKDGILSLKGDDKAAIDTLAEWIDVAETAGVINEGTSDADQIGVVAFEVDGNTYLIERSDGTNDGDIAGDTLATEFVIELTGVTGVDSLSTSNEADSVFIA